MYKNKHGVNAGLWACRCENEVRVIWGNSKQGHTLMPGTLRHIVRITSQVILIIL